MASTSFDEMIGPETLTSLLHCRWRDRAFCGLAALLFANLTMPRGASSSTKIVNFGRGLGLALEIGLELGLGVRVLVDKALLLPVLEASL